MAAVEQASSSMNGDIRFTIGHEDGQDLEGDPPSLQDEVML